MRWLMAAFKDSFKLVMLGNELRLILYLLNQLILYWLKPANQLRLPTLMEINVSLQVHSHPDSQSDWNQQILPP